MRHLPLLAFVCLGVALVAGAAGSHADLGPTPDPNGSWLQVGAAPGRLGPYRLRLAPHPDPHGIQLQLGPVPDPNGWRLRHGPAPDPNGLRVQLGPTPDPHG
jgi:hypothetical protein